MTTKVKIVIDRKHFEIAPGLIPGSELINTAGISSPQQLLLERKDDLDIPVLADDFLIIDGEEIFSIGDGKPPIEENPCLRRPIHFFFNGGKVDGSRALHHAKLFGRDLKRFDPEAQPSDGLFADITGFADEPIRDDQRILVQNRDRFITTPCGNVGDVGLQQDPLSHQLAEVRKAFPNATLNSEGDSNLLVLPTFNLPSHWIPESTDILIIVPNGYPLASLDMFFVAPQIKLLNGNVPKGGDNYQVFLGRNWQRFSWHYQGHQWNPAKDTLISHIHFCQTRLGIAE